MTFWIAAAVTPLLGTDNHVRKSDVATTRLETRAKCVASRLCLDFFAANGCFSGHRPDATIHADRVLQGFR
jgi:hypothetical protein